MTKVDHPGRKITVTAAVFEKHGRFLIARRKEEGQIPSKWEFPGGKVEAGETPEACLRRELREEFGIEVVVGGFVGLSRHRHRRGEIELLAYRVDHVSGDFHLHDHEEILWIPPAELLSYDLSPADIPIARILREGIHAGNTACPAEGPVL